MPGEFDFFSEEPAAKPKPKTPVRDERRLDDDDDPPRNRPASRRPRNEQDDDDRDPVPKKKASPLLIGGIIAGAILVLAGGVVGIVFAVSGGSKTTAPKDKGGTTTATTKPVVAPKKDKEPTDINTPTRETVEKVKKATVRVLVLMADGKGSSGSGFVEKDSRLVLTNAHVVGMKKPTDPKPKAINLVVNSGEGDKEYRLSGELMAVDTENDLALIFPRLLEIGERHIVPDGLVVPKTTTAVELDKLFVFGFPLGDQLGAEISVRPTTVTKLRRESGKLKELQVEGGMTFGNSGGPVVDPKGNVVGVAKSGIRNETINFCVPGEVVHQFLVRENKR